MSKAVDPTSSKAKGLAFFRQARRTVLTQQMRAAEDPEFQADLLQLRDTTLDTPVPTSLVKSLKEVTLADVRAEPHWAFATVAVLSNYERHHLNRVWHRLEPWPDSVEGLTRLKSRYIISSLSNGNIGLLTEMAKNELAKNNPRWAEVYCPRGLRPKGLC